MYTFYILNENKLFKEYIYIIFVILSFNWLFLFINQQTSPGYICSEGCYGVCPALSDSTHSCAFQVLKVSLYNFLDPLLFKKQIYWSVVHVP